MNMFTLLCNKLLPALLYYVAANHHRRHPMEKTELRVLDAAEFDPAKSEAAKSGWPKQKFHVSHLREEDFKVQGLRAYTLSRDLGFAEATGGMVEAHVNRRGRPFNAAASRASASRVGRGSSRVRHRPARPCLATEAKREGAALILRAARRATRPAGRRRRHSLRATPLCRPA